MGTIERIYGTIVSCALAISMVLCVLYSIVGSLLGWNLGNDTGYGSRGDMYTVDVYGM